MMLAAAARGLVPIGSSLYEWEPLLYPGSVSDYQNDSLTGISDLEMIGDADNPSFYTRFSGHASAPGEESQVGFRMRMSGNQGSRKFQGRAWVAIDVNFDGWIDAFIGADEKSLSIHAVGDGPNDSPSTTSIEKKAYWSGRSDRNTFDWSPVTRELDPEATSLDLDNAGGQDYFLTFVLPFDVLVSALIDLTELDSFDETSTVAYLAATGTNGVQINADINGLNGGIDSTISWKEAEAFAEKVNITGQAVPEPSLYGLIAGLSVLFILARRRQSH